jgi:hypothetical protein
MKGRELHAGATAVLRMAKMFGPTVQRRITQGLGQVGKMINKVKGQPPSPPQGYPQQGYPQQPYPQQGYPS